MRSTASSERERTLLGLAVEGLRELAGDATTRERELVALAEAVVDAVLAGDGGGLAEAVDVLRDAIARLSGNDRDAEARGWLTGLLATVRGAVERLPSDDEFERMRGTLAERMLSALGEGERGSSELKGALATSDAQVSRAGRELVARGLVVQRRVGRNAHWTLSPRGRQLLDAEQARIGSEPSGHGRRRRSPRAADR